ncbi:MAG: hypothetical protein AMXMBFR33_65720 [Candidatus Xenobia bacterium]
MSLERDGYALLEGVIPEAQVQELIALLEGSGHGRRDLLELEPVRGLARQVGPLAGPGAFPVRGLFFDKPPEANWQVPWHQDLAIAVRERIEIPGYSGWSVKNGIPHVQPPAEVLERMLAVRISLDDCTSDNGPLRVIPGTHRLGRLSSDQIAQMSRVGPAVECCVPAGGAVLMRPLLLHASSKARKPGHRRVIHLEMARGDLPGGLSWQARAEKRDR